MSASELTVVVVVAAGLVLVGLIVIPTLVLGISPMPTSPRVRRVVLEQVSPGTLGEIHELGAAWGSLAFPLAARCPKAQVIAWERSPVPWLFLKLRQVVTPQPNLTVRFGNFLKADLTRAQVVVCYLWTGGMEQLKPRVLAELPEGALVVSHTFAFHGWKEDRVTRAEDLYRTPVYRYVIRRAAPPGEGAQQA